MMVSETKNINRRRRHCNKAKKRFTLSSFISFVLITTSTSSSSSTSFTSSTTTTSIFPSVIVTASSTSTFHPYSRHHHSHVSTSTAFVTNAKKHYSKRCSNTFRNVVDHSDGAPGVGGERGGIYTFSPSFLQYQRQNNFSRRNGIVLFSTIQRKTHNKNDVKKKNKPGQRKRKGRNHNKMKTFKTIKEERLQLESMRNAVSSSPTSTNGSSNSSNIPAMHTDNAAGNSSSSYTHSKTIKLETEKGGTKIKNNVAVPELEDPVAHQKNDEVKSHQPKQKQHSFKQRVRDINIDRLSLTKAEEKRSSDRRIKAFKLLDDFTTTDPSFGDEEDNDDRTSSTATISTDDKKAASTTESSSSSSPSDVGEDITKTVPDTYWYNGNLQKGKGDYVTRWARGMKVAEPLRKYDPIEAEKLLFRQPTKWLVRNVQIGFPLATWAVGVVYDISTNQEETNRKSRAKQLLRTISGLGPAIIKGGQALASRSDLMPSEYLEELQKLQDDVPRFKNELAFNTVERELGVEFDSIFELIEKDPIAAASIGQVYKARLRTNGDLVALKIQRPECESVIALDLYVLRWWSGVANVLTRLLNRDIDVQSIIDDFGELIYRELDYIAEAANAQRFSELYANEVKDVFVPKVYSELTTSKVLTMEWVEGFRLTDNDSLEKYGLDRKKLVDTLVQCSLRQILGNGFFHADPHAGNLLVVSDGRLCYLDFGMMSYAAGPQRNGFLLAVVHIVNRDWDELVRMYQRLGFIPEGTDLEPIAIALEKSLPDALNSDISELNFKNVVSQLGDIFYTYPFSLPPFYISIIRCLGVLEGLAIQVDPQARIIREAYPYIASRVLTDTQGELKEALRRLALTNEGKVRWNRLERLLSEAKDSQGYDVSVAVSSLTDYLISDDGEQLLNDFIDEIVEGVDSLGEETISYLVEASRALVIQDEVAAVKAFRTLEVLLQSNNEEAEKKLGDQLRDTLPPPTPSMKQVGRIATLLGARGSTSDPSKLIPIVRKLSQEPKIQRVSSEILARLGERILSRSLRAMFGLPPTNGERR